MSETQRIESRDLIQASEAFAAESNNFSPTSVMHMMKGENPPMYTYKYVCAYTETDSK